MIDPILKDLIILTNHERIKRHLNPVLESPILIKAAFSHANDMQLNDFISHTGSDGSSYIDRVKREGGKSQPSGEIICKGPGGINAVQSVIDGWLESPGHRAILLHPYNKYVGFGYRLKTLSLKGNYWVGVFAEKDVSRRP
jgi:uncharacterized protein YkwD